jgi:hypothetical protein
LETLNHYPWSSYLGYIGAIPHPPFVEEGPLLKLVAGNSPNPRLAYRQFVETALASSDTELRDLLHSSTWGIGDEEFQAQVEAHQTCRLPQEVCELAPSLRRRQGRRSQEEVMAVVAEVCGFELDILMRRQYRCPARAIAARMLWVHAGLSQKTIAQLLQMGGTASVCARLRRLELTAKADRKLRELLARIDARLNVDC